MTIPHIGIRQLVNAGVHFGHTSRRWNPKMKPFIFGTRDNIHIMDLQQTAPLLHQALLAVRDVAAKGGRVLFVGTKRQASDKIAAAAEKCGQYYVNHRWLGGMLTNWNTVSNSIKSLEEIEKRLEKLSDRLTKKELLTLQRKQEKLQLALGGIRNMAGTPDILIVIDTNKEDIAVLEATKLGIPIVGILDSNADPDLITHPVPGNDDAARSIDLYCEAFAAAILDGLQENIGDQADIGAMENPPVEEAANTEDKPAAAAATA